MGKHTNNTSIDIEQALKSVRDVYVNYPKRYHLAQESLKRVDQEIQDLLHVIELCSIDAIGMIKKYKELRELRQERRKLKNEIELLEEIMSFVNYPKPTEKLINTSIGRIRTTLENQQKRTYKMRVRKDLQELMK